MYCHDVESGFQHNLETCVLTPHLMNPGHMSGWRATGMVRNGSIVVATRSVNPPLRKLHSCL